MTSAFYPIVPASGWWYNLAAMTMVLSISYTDEDVLVLQRMRWSYKTSDAGALCNKAVFSQLDTDNNEVDMVLE